MAALAEKLTFAEFQSKYKRDDKSFEYWYGEAIPKGMPTSIHGLLQVIIAHLLMEAGFNAGAEVELRIIPDARPKPDIIATRGEFELPYPTKAIDVVAEILSEDDSMSYVLEKCRAYHDWGFEYIYIVNPDNRQVFRWGTKGLEISGELTSIPAARIWEELDRTTGKRSAS